MLGLQGYGSDSDEEKDDAPQAPESTNNNNPANTAESKEETKGTFSLSLPPPSQDKKRIGFRVPVSTELFKENSREEKIKEREKELKELSEKEAASSNKRPFAMTSSKLSFLPAPKNATDQASTLSLRPRSVITSSSSESSSSSERPSKIQKTEASPSLSSATSSNENDDSKDDDDEEIIQPTISANLTSLADLIAPKPQATKRTPSITSTLPASTITTTTTTSITNTRTPKSTNVNSKKIGPSLPNFPASQFPAYEDPYANDQSYPSHVNSSSDEALTQQWRQFDPSLPVPGRGFLGGRGDSEALANATFVEINSANLRDNSPAAQYKQHANDARKVLATMGGGVAPVGKGTNSNHKRRGQITYLAQQAREKEMEVFDRGAASRKTKMEVKQKYGW